MFVRAAIDSCDQYTTNYKRGNTSVAQQVLYTGNGNKSLHLSVEASLKKLRTSYIDLLYVHWWDYETSIEEVMRSLHTLITARKVLYLVGLQLSCCQSSSEVALSRVSRTPPRGSWRRRTSMHGTMP
jgi:aryl-alcohol dehydrogenase-like predicted oxidoreductase